MVKYTLVEALSFSTGRTAHRGIMWQSQLRKLDNTDVCNCYVTLALSGLFHIRISKSGTDLWTSYCHAWFLSLYFIYIYIYIYIFFLDSWTLRMGPIGCPEISVKNDRYSLRNNPEGRSYYSLYGLAASRFPLESLNVRVGSEGDHWNCKATHVLRIQGGFCCRYWL